MSLRELHPRTRRRLRWHGWLLTAWCLAVGLASSWTLLHVFDVTLPAARYAMSALLMYALGLVLGVQVWLKHFAASVRATPRSASGSRPSPHHAAATPRRNPSTGATCSAARPTC